MVSNEEEVGQEDENARADGALVLGLDALARRRHGTDASSTNVS